MTDSVYHIVKIRISLEDITSIAELLGYRCQRYNHVSGEVLDIRGFGGVHWAYNGTKWYHTDDYFMCWDGIALTGAEDDERAFVEAFNPEAVVVWSFHRPSLPILLNLLREIMKIYGGVIWGESELTYSEENIDALSSEFPLLPANSQKP